MEYKRIIMQWLEFKIPKTLPRETEIKLDPEFISTVTGPRRAGKTYLCFDLIHKLQEKGTPKNNILYINFEDEKLLGAKAEDLEGLFLAYQELANPGEGKKYLFFDEIQNVESWDVWVRRTHDMRQDVRIVLTGSSSRLLSREISTKLRGRVLNTLLLPLSFKEYLDWEKVKFDKKTVIDSKSSIAVKRAFSEYLKQGGYPVLLRSKADSETVLQEYFKSMIFRDVVERHGVKEIKKLRILADLLFSSTAKEISYNNLANKLKSLGYDMSKNTIIEYLSYFEDAYLFFQNIKYEYSIAKQLGAIKKVYCIDNGLLNAVSFKFSDDFGKLVENLTYVELLRRGIQTYYFKNGGECDFLLAEKDRITGAIQVTNRLDEGNRDRELKGLVSAMDKYGLKKGILLVNEGESELIKLEGGTIEVIPLWKWLID